MTVQKQHRVKLYVQYPGESGWTDYGVWPSMSAIEFGSDASEPYYPGGMAPSVSLGGATQTISEVTLKKVVMHDLTDVVFRDRKKLRANRGKAKAKVVDQPLDGDGAAFDQADTVYGDLTSITGAEVDAKSSEGNEYEVVVTPYGDPT